MLEPKVENELKHEVVGVGKSSRKNVQRPGG